MQRFFWDLGEEEEERYLRVQLSVNAHDRPWLQVAGLTGLHDAISPAGAKFLPGYNKSESQVLPDSRFSF